jgi:hypothetical protein
VFGRWSFRMFSQFERLADATATYGAEGTRQDLDLLH